MNSLQIKNYTPHTINIITEYGDYELPSVGNCRIDAKLVQFTEFEGIPIFITQYGEIVGAPPKDDLTNLYIVSMVVKTKLIEMGWTNVASPVKLVRDEKGNVVGCEGLDM